MLAILCAGTNGEPPVKRRTVLAGVPAGAIAQAAAPLCRPAIGQNMAARVVRFVPQANLTSPDPVWTTANVTRNHAYMVWDTLYGLSTDLRPSPQMCAGHDMSEDGLTWRFTLRDGLLFHDGEPVRATDCIASLARWSKRDTFGQLLAARLANMTVLDDRRFQLQLTRPFPILIRAIAANNCFMMPERIARTDPFKQIDEIVGSGPFRFVRDEWVAGSRAVYARFDRYQPREEAPDFTAGGKSVKVDRVEWNVMPDPATASAALQSGEVDWLEQPLIDLLPLLRRNPNIRVETLDPFGVVGVVVFNHLHPPFDNVKLRRALLPAIDQTEYVAAVMGNESTTAKTGVGVFTVGSPLANTSGLDVLTGPRDVALARKLVAESGYRGESVVLLSPSDYASLQAVAQVTRDVFQRVGLNVDYVSTDWGTVIARRASKEPVEKGGWSTFVTTADGIGLANPIGNNMIRGAGANGWFGWPASPRLRALREAWLDASDMAAQVSIAEDIQRTVWDEVPYIPVGQWSLPVAYRTRLSGIVRSGYPTFWNVAKS
jgi:peptide/nickel transport system substrate-binding protein